MHLRLSLSAFSVLILVVSAFGGWGLSGCLSTPMETSTATPPPQTATVQPVHPAVTPSPTAGLRATGARTTPTAKPGSSISGKATPTATATPIPPAEEAYPAPVPQPTPTPQPYP
ncbi:MAG: hypothetical protein M1136_10520 [Chloroflexi bacterium]|nr:hypothetical protein [Chloroflexota bacterium]MCL5076060.1 hypothetical protein [Chloroflexota bacterium]